MSDKQADAREVAFLVAKGDMPDVVAQKTDLPRAYIDDLTHTDTFRETLEKVGGKSAVDLWDEYQLERESKATLKTKVRERLADYFKELDDIAMDHKVKPEVRKDIILKLMSASGALEEQGQAVQTIELPPTFFTALAQANEELDRWKRKKQLTNQ